MSMTAIKKLASILFVLLAIQFARANNSSLLAQTQQGVYIGRQTVNNGTIVNYWYGIPYAQQPIGNLRWMPPQALTTSNGTNKAYIPNACPQSTSFGVLQTEACLTLNVYAPENATDLPVYVWIHGGGFITGAGINYNAASFITTSIIHSVPIVIVTINYRLGLLGFLADSALYDERSGANNKRTTGNYGILDQIMALDWIKKNINGFGGNPTQITVGGESAGGVSITILLTSPLYTVGIFQRAIIESGGIWPNRVNTLEDAINGSGNVLRTVMNCTTVQCLRNSTVDQILAVQNTMTSQNIFGISALPAIDGYVLNDTVENNYAKGNFQKVPLLIGSNTNETSLYTCPVFNETANITQVQAFFNTTYSATIVNQIPTIYGPISAYNNPLTYLNIVFSDSWGHCGSRRIASKVSSYGIPVFFYTYNHLIPATLACLGVPHTAELPMLFPSLLPYIYPNYTFTESERQLSTDTILYWTHFIYTSNPNYDGSPANWDVYLPSSDDDFVLDISPRMRNYYYSTTCSGFWDLYAATNISSTSSTVQCMNKHQQNLVLSILFLSKLLLVSI